MAVEVVINVYVVSEKMDPVIDKLKLLPEVVDLYEVTGESDIIVLIRTEDISSFREFLKNKLMKIDGVRSTVTSVVLHRHKREGKIIEV
ncbi:MAG: Lrp/AsnC ligand binding domain-containing protein [Candidatus Odinarchaeota archaeon]